MTTSRSLLTMLFLSCLLGIVYLGCNEDVVPVIDTGRPFTLFGLFTPDLDTQWVRVFPIENSLVQAKPEPIDALVTSQELETGDLREWQDSLLQEEDGKYSHVFWSPFRAIFGSSYLLEAIRSDGLKSHVEVVVPPKAEIIVEEPYEAGFVAQTVVIKGDIPHLLNAVVDYSILFEQIYEDPIIGRDTFLTPFNFVFPLDDRMRRVGNESQFTLNLTKDHDILNDLIPTTFVRPTPHEIYLWDIEVRMIAASEAWDPPGGVLDPEVLIQPGTMSNVENGFGFIGAGYRLKKEWIPPREWIEKAGFRYLENV